MALSFSASLEELIGEHYRGRRILVTGHNGFVGSWLSHWLVRSGAEVTGLSLAAEPDAMFDTIGLESAVASLEIDVRDSAAVTAAIADHQPEVIFHLAAQAIVLRSIEDPLETISTNVLGTANLLQGLRGSTVKACVVITSDKCYETASAPHVESDRLGGDDPYSASKAAAELVVHAFANSYFLDSGPAVASARAGNIVGGGDRAPNRLVPDFVRAAELDRSLELRYSEAVRPWQHVLEAVAGYLRLGAALMKDPLYFAGSWNFGPPPGAGATVGHLVDLLRSSWHDHAGSWPKEPSSVTALEPERALLMLESSKARRELGWESLLDLNATIDWTVAWYLAEQVQGRAGALRELEREITQYQALDLAKSREAKPV